MGGTDEGGCCRAGANTKCHFLLMSHQGAAGSGHFGKQGNGMRKSVLPGLGAQLGVEREVG